MINYRSSPYGAYDAFAQYHQQEQEQAMREYQHQQQRQLVYQEQQQRAYHSSAIGSCNPATLSGGEGMLPLPIGYSSYGPANDVSPTRNQMGHPGAPLAIDYYPMSQEHSPVFYGEGQTQLDYPGLGGTFARSDAYSTQAAHQQHFVSAVQYGNNASRLGDHIYPESRVESMLPPSQMGNVAPSQTSAFQHQPVDNASWQASILPPALYLSRQAAAPVPGMMQYPHPPSYQRTEDYREDAESLWSGYGEEAAVAEMEQFQHQQQQEAAAHAAVMQHQQPVVNFEQSANDEWQLIASDATAIPPPPSIEKSAYPLAALATDLVWDAFLTASNRTSPLSSTSGQFSCTDSGPASPVVHRGGATANSKGPLPVGQHQRTPSKPISPFSRKHDRSRSASAGIDSDGAGSAQQARSFGAIGGERKPRPSIETSPGSDMSSPASSAPGTPAMDSWTVPGSVDASRHHHRGLNPLGASRFGNSGYWSDEEHASSAAAVDAHGKQASLPPISSLLRPAFQQQPQRFGGVTPPMALFEQVQGLLRATLVSQQVLLLALYYVARIPQTSPLYPPATSQSALQSTSAPFKLLLAALVVANKHLDDNSFRNSTWAQVANITQPEVNALEFSLLAGLNFNINVEASDWMAYLVDTRRHRATRFSEDQVPVGSFIDALIEGVNVQEQHQAHAKALQRHAISLSSDALPRQLPSISESGRQRRSRKASHGFAPVGPDYGVPLTPRSETSSMSGGFDLDAAGPIEQRPRYAKQFETPADASAAPAAFGPAHPYDRPRFSQSLSHPYKPTQRPTFSTSISNSGIGFRAEQEDELMFGGGRCFEQGYGRLGMDGYRYPGRTVMA